MTQKTKTKKPTSKKIEPFYGINVTHGTDRFFTVRCPCSVEVTYPMNGIPEVTTLMPCGNKDHFAIYFSEEPDGTKKEK